MKHLHHSVRAYDNMTKEGGLKFSTDIEVHDYKTEEEAINAVKEIVKRKHYWLVSVKECEMCDFYKEQNANQRYIAASLGSAHGHDEE